MVLEPSTVERLEGIFTDAVTLYYWPSIYANAWILTIPIVIFNRYIYAKLTKQPFVFSDINFIEILLLIAYVVQFEIHLTLLGEEGNAEVMIQSQDPDDAIQYAASFIKHLSENEFNI